MNPPAETLALPPGTRLAEFELLEVMAIGGFGIVYRARDWSLEREVAIKEYMPNAIASREGQTQISVLEASGRELFEIGLRSFINEAKLLARFDHPSLLKVHRFWEANGTAYMAMPLLRGQTLREVQAAWSAPPDESWLRQLLKPLLEALAVLHGAGVFHRDIAPHNINLEPGGRPVLLDFGAARRALSGITDATTVVLRPSYAPVEQYANAEQGPLRQGAWTDLYALGATLHFLLRGKPPPVATQRAVRDEMKPLGSEPLPGCSIEFLGCVDWMLAPRPEDRPASVESLWTRLFGGPLAVGDNHVVEFLGQGGGSTGSPAPQGVDPFESLFGSPPSQTANGSQHTSARRAHPPDWRPFGTEGPAKAVASAPAPAAPAPHEPAAPAVAASASAQGLLGRWWRRLFSTRAPATPPSPPPPRAASRSAAPPSGDMTVLLPLGSSQLLAPPAPPTDTTVMLRAERTGPDPASPGLALTVLRCDVGSFVGHVHALRPGETLIGRGSDANLSLADPGLSLRHARVDLGAGGAELTDLGSTNGTWVNGVRVAAHRAFRLTLGATIQMGTTVLSVSRTGPLALPDLSGRTIDGRYEIRTCLHTSPKGAVYAAVKQPSGLEVVLKILSPDYAADLTYRNRFAAEARIATQLQHPHICRLDDHGETVITVSGHEHRVPYAAYPSLGGGNLAQRTAQFGSLTPDTIERWIRDAASALAHAHAAGMVHGNLKPSALCFDTAENIYVTDFAGSGTGIDGAALFGTPGFTAPEQWRGEPVQAASDQYALAAIAYCMLTGARPHDGGVDPVTRDQILAAPPPAAHLEAAKRYGRTLSPAVTAVLNQALASEPGERFPSIEQFASDLGVALRRGRSAGARHVFISYRRDEAAMVATYIAERLEQRHDITSFVDVQGLDGAARFPTRIERAIAECEVFVCILGAQTLKSPYVRRELALAAEHGKPMIPVFQESYTMPDEAEIDAAVNDLLQYDGIQLLDRRNIYVPAAVDELARQVRRTLERRALR